jgi:hypothetical protein
MATSSAGAAPTGATGDKPASSGTGPTLPDDPIDLITAAAAVAKIDASDPNYSWVAIDADTASLVVYRTSGGSIDPDLDAKYRATLPPGDTLEYSAALLSLVHVTQLDALVGSLRPAFLDAGLTINSASRSTPASPYTVYYTGKTSLPVSLTSQFDAFGAGSVQFVEGGSRRLAGEISILAPFGAGQAFTEP